MRGSGEELHRARAAGHIALFGCVADKQCDTERQEKRTLRGKKILCTSWENGIAYEIYGRTILGNVYIPKRPIFKATVFTNVCIEFRAT